MRAAIFRNGRIVVDDIEEPEPASGQVLVKSLACGICGSDITIKAHAQRINALLRSVPWRKGMDFTRDLVFGHEFCCEILDFGPDCNRRLKAGTRVVSVPRMIIEERIERIGYSHINIGGFAERLLLSEGYLLEVPNGLSNHQAALTEPLAVGLHAVNKARLTGEEVPLVIGCGPVGLAVIVALRRLREHARLGPIVAADYSPKRREMAQILGADVVIDPGQVSAFRAWETAAKEPAATLPLEERSTLPPMPASKLGRFKPAVIFECTGRPGVMMRIFEGAAQEARIIGVGICMETDHLEPILGSNKELSLQYVQGYSLDEFEKSLHLLADGEMYANVLVTGTVDLNGVEGAIEMLTDPVGHGKIMVEPWRPSRAEHETTVG